jgi:hypothetical protein
MNKGQLSRKHEGMWKKVFPRTWEDRTKETRISLEIGQTFNTALAGEKIQAGLMQQFAHNEAQFDTQGEM